MGITAHLPSGRFGTGSTLAGAVKTFGPFPLPSMIPALQSGELRKHSPVRLNDLYRTSAGLNSGPLVNVA